MQGGDQNGEKSKEARKGNDKWETRRNERQKIYVKNGHDVDGIEIS